ncbi:MAG TPA: MFS transporter [Candidatus Baltobacteraceae bacterium]|jgi:MFS family permease|nr:MFS transporter [Candidatus Baltobacteraceae bacterium]
MAILAEGVGFAVRGGILGQWAQQYGFTNTELGLITGGGLTGFGVIIILSSLIADKVGYGTLMFSAFVLHGLSAIVTLGAGMAFASGGKPAALHCLIVGMFLFAMGNGLCEGVANPLVASLFPKKKAHYLNILHAGWPGGLILGALASYFMSGGATPVAWQIQMCLFLIPVALYGIMLFGQKFPKSEAKEHGVKYTDMLKELGMGGALILCFLLALWLHDLAGGLGLPDYLGWVGGGVLLLAFGMVTKFSPGYFLMVLLLLIHSMQGYVELGTDSWVSKITGAILVSPQKGLLVFVYIQGWMFALRFFAGPIIHKVSPLGLMLISTILASIGLTLLGHADSAIFCVAAGTVYAIGKTFMWPTLLAVVSERFPKGGAITIGAMGGAGMLCAGLLGGPGIGFNQDNHAATKLLSENPEVFKRYQAEAPNTFLFFQTTGLDGSKVGVLDDNGADLAKQNQSDPNIAKLSAWWAGAKATAAQDAPIVTAAELHGSKMAMRITAVIPLFQAFLLLCILIYFRSKGGYKQVHIEGEGAAAREVP